MKNDKRLSFLKQNVMSQKIPENKLSFSLFSHHFLTYETKLYFLEALRVFSLEAYYVLSNFPMRSQ